MSDPMTLNDAAALLGLSGSGALRQAIKRGKLAATKYGTTYVISAAEVERYRAESLGNQGNRRRCDIPSPHPAHERHDPTLPPCPGVPGPNGPIAPLDYYAKGKAHA